MKTRLVLAVYVYVAVYVTLSGAVAVKDNITKLHGYGNGYDPQN